MNARSTGSARWLGRIIAAALVAGIGLAATGATAYADPPWGHDGGDRGEWHHRDWHHHDWHHDWHHEDDDGWHGGYAYAPPPAYYPPPPAYYAPPPPVYVGPPSVSFGVNIPLAH
ncbi:MAG TPA: hypothetical protein PLV07_08995 [Acidiphilium sp.]|uniref:hypothetical protein n=1 Tax=unclassified Acidiphilium TaxID=2617493 RepID=UPI0025C667F0|nr:MULTISPECIES: hypothetical protein [unclassified Acidiphilium]HQT62380.1 hypothetical protein [Acidiphilium sp.]HQU11706.1 hypothetical protein [Acidiphilium sp.]